MTKLHNKAYLTEKTAIVLITNDYQTFVYYSLRFKQEVGLIKF